MSIMKELFLIDDMEQKLFYPTPDMQVICLSQELVLCTSNEECAITNEVYERDIINY